MLEALYHCGPMALCSIGEKLLVTSGNITFVAGQLEKSGLVKRQRSRDDRRVIVARLTARGEALIDKHFPSHADCIRVAAQRLSSRDQGELATLLKRWGKAVQAASAAAG